MGFCRELLPEPIAYFSESEGLSIVGSSSAKWVTAECKFHGGSDSLRINRAAGAWVCMACHEKGGDVLAYHMQRHGLEFVAAAKELGAWVEDGRQNRPSSSKKPKSLSPRLALEVLGFETTVVAVAAGNLAEGRGLKEADFKRLIICVSRINRIVQEFVS